MQTAAKVIAATSILTSSIWSGGQSLRPIATYDLPVRRYATFGGCSVAADASYAVIGVSWGGRSPTTGGYDHSCRGYALIDLRTGSRRTIVRLPAKLHSHEWAVDDPVLVGDWLAYQRYISTSGGDWEIDIVNIRDGAVRRLDRWHGHGIVDNGPAITKWGNTLTWVSGIRDALGRVVFQIHTYDVASGRGQIVATSPPGVQFVDAYMSGPLLCFLRGTSRGTDVWVEDRRTRHFRRLTNNGKATEAVITGPWVAWHELGPGTIGPVMVEDLRTGRQRTVTTEPSYVLTAGNGLLAWYASPTDRWRVLDLMSDRTLDPGPIARKQEHATMARVQGDVVVENAMTPIGLAGRVEVYRDRHLPVVPKL